MDRLRRQRSGEQRRDGVSKSDHGETRSARPGSVERVLGNRAAVRVQTKLSLGRADDPLEDEADRVARAIVSGAPVQVQAQDTTASTASSADDEVSAAVESTIRSSRGGGSPLPDGFMTDMSNAFGVDLSAVRVHRGEAANTMNRELSARAFTTGTDIFLRDGEPGIESMTGRELMAHELTHVVQQGGGSPTGLVETDQSVQLKPTPVRSLGITHLVEERDGSLFAGSELGALGELDPGERLVIDDQHIFLSRRGPNQEVQENRDRDAERDPDRVWYQVVEVKGRDIRDYEVYVREGTFRADDDPYVSGVEGDDTGGATLKKFDNAIRLFRENSEMSFDEFTKMLRRVGFEGSIHATENPEIVESQFARQGLIDQLEHASNLARQPLYGDAELVRTELLIGAFDGRGCLAAQSRSIADKKALVDRLLDAHIDEPDLSAAIGGDARAKVLKLIEERLDAYLQARELGKHVKFLDDMEPVLRACDAVVRLERRHNSRLINRTLSKMYELMTQLVADGEDTNVTRILSEIVREYTSYRSIWSKLCPELLDQVPELSTDAEDHHRQLEVLRKAEEAAEYKPSSGIVKKILAMLGAEKVDVVQKIGKELSLKILYAPHGDGSQGGFLTIEGRGSTQKRFIQATWSDTVKTGQIEVMVTKAVTG